MRPLPLGRPVPAASRWPEPFTPQTGCSGGACAVKAWTNNSDKREGHRLPVLSWWGGTLLARTTSPATQSVRLCATALQATKRPPPRHFLLPGLQEPSGTDWLWVCDGRHLPASLLLFHSLWSRGRRKQRESGCRTVHVRKEGSWTGLLTARSPKLCILGKRRAYLCIHWNSGHYCLFSCSVTTNSLELLWPKCKCTSKLNTVSYLNFYTKQN